MSAPVAHTEPAAGVPGESGPSAPRLLPREPHRGVRALAPFSRAAIWWPALLIAGVLCWVAFFAGGGLNLARMTTVEVALTIGSALLSAAAVVSMPAGHRRYGGLSLGLLIAFSALTAVSVVWSVQPDNSWQDAGRMFAYSGLFGASVVLARAASGRWPAVLGGVVLAAAVVCGWALATKVFPAEFDAGEVYARLRAPYSYWNAIGLTAAMGAMGCMWLGARRRGHALLSALAYPAMGLMLLTLLLAYSRGALVALVVGLVIWFGIVPLRLRGAAVLMLGAGAAAGVVAWAFSRHALSSDNVPLATRTAAGHQLGALVAVMLVVLTVAGVSIGFFNARRARLPTTRRRIGTILLSVLAIAIVGFFAGLTVSHRGLSGSISHAFHSLTDPHAPVPPNTPGRLTAVASVRARYWNEALKVFKAHPALGSGAEGYATARLRYRTETLDVRHAHGYLVQTLADLGLVGLVLTLGLLVSWMSAAGRCTHPFNRRWTSWRTLTEWRSGARPGWRRARVPYTPERIGLLSMLSVVIVFGVHSLADWTWYVPGNACVALLCAGWLAGRGPLGARQAPEPSGGRSPSHAVTLPLVGRVRADRRSLVVAGAALIASLLAAWTQLQPQRAVDASQSALALLKRDPGGAEGAAKAAVARDPLSAQALVTLSAVYQATGRQALARAALERAVRLQPSNPQTWLALGEYDLARQGGGGQGAGTGARAAVGELGAAIYLNPELITPEAINRGNREAIAVQNAYITASRESTAAAALPTPAPRSRASRGRGARTPRAHP